MKNLTKFLGIIAIGAVISFGLAGCDNGTTDSGGSDGGSDAWSILNGTTWIKEGQTEFPKFKYENMGGPGQYCYDASGSQIGINGQIKFDGNKVTTPGGEILAYNFELTENNSKLVITNFSENASHAMNGTYTKR